MHTSTSIRALAAALVTSILLAACGEDTGGPSPGIEEGEWGTRAGLPVARSRLALAAANGKLYLLGGYPATRVTSRTVQVYDIASDEWTLGPELPAPNNHGMAASVNGKVYLIGGQTSDASDQGYVNTVY